MNVVFFDHEIIPDNINKLSRVPSRINIGSLKFNDKNIEVTMHIMSIE